MRYIDHLKKTVIANYLFREILRQEIPVKGKFVIEVELSKGEVKKLNFKKEG